MRNRLLTILLVIGLIFGMLPVNTKAAETAAKTYSVFEQKIPFANVYDCYWNTDLKTGNKQRVFQFDYPYCTSTGKTIEQAVPQVKETPEEYYYQLTEQDHGTIELAMYQYTDKDFKIVLSSEGTILSYGDGCFLFQTKGGYGTFISLRDYSYHRHGSSACKNDHRPGNDTCAACLKNKKGQTVGKCGEFYTIELLNPETAQLKNLSVFRGMIEQDTEEILETVETAEAEAEREAVESEEPETTVLLTIEEAEEIGEFLIAGDSDGYKYDEEAKCLSFVQGGTYQIASREIVDGSIKIAASDVKLIFHGLSLSPDVGAAITFAEAEEEEDASVFTGTEIILTEGSVNALTSNGGVACSAIENKSNPLTISCSNTDDGHVCTKVCGKLSAKVNSLGGAGMNGNVTIHGGVIEAVGNSGPGIGGYWEDGSNILITGGIIDANGIGANGGYSNAENIVITGGVVETTYIGGGKYGNTEVYVEPSEGRKIAVCDGIKHRFARNFEGSPFSERTEISDWTRRATFIKIMEK